MKRFIIFLIALSLFVVSLNFVSSAVTSKSCSQSGYDYCWEAENTDWLPARAYAQVFYSIKTEGSRVYIDYGYVGNALYFIESMTSWGNTGCTLNNYCNPIAKSSSRISTAQGNGQYTLSNTGEYIGCPVLLAWDYNSNSGYEAWVYSAYGWLGSGNCITVKTQQATCVENWQCSGWSQCSSNAQQSRTCTDLNNCGTTTIKPLETITCTPPVTSCSLGQEVCSGNNVLVCENTQSGNAYVNKGQIQGKCNVPIQQKSAFFRLENNRCNVVNIFASEKTSNDYSTLTECESKIIIEDTDGANGDTDGTNGENKDNLLFIFIGIMIAIIFVIWLIMRRK